MEIIECIKSRADVREYKPDPVPDDVIKEVLAAAVQAPSSGNIQNWEFIVVKGPKIKEQLSNAALGQGFIITAPIVIVVAANLELISPKYGTRGITLYSIQNTAAATQNLLLAAWDKGIASCWVGAFNEAEVKRILNLPVNVRPLAIITLGWPATKPTKQVRRDMGEVTHFEIYGKKI